MSERPPSLARSVESDTVKINPRQITTLGTISLLINSMTGPGLVTLPLITTQAGWLTPLLAILLTSAMSFFASFFVIKCWESLQAWQEQPEKENQVEFLNILDYYVNYKGLRRFNYCWIYLSLQSMVVASIVISANTLDESITRIFQKSCGLAIYPRFSWVCLDLTASSPASNWFLFTVGFLVVFSSIFGPNNCA